MQFGSNGLDPLAGAENLGGDGQRLHRNSPQHVQGESGHPHRHRGGHLLNRSSQQSGYGTAVLSTGVPRPLSVDRRNDRVAVLIENGIVAHKGGNVVPHCPLARDETVRRHR